MMNPQLLVAVLADAVTVRENLLHVLGGGITALARPEYPAPLGAQLGLTVYTQIPSGEQQSIVFGITCRSAEDEVAFELEGQLEIMSHDGSVPASASIAVPLENAGVPAPGLYFIEVKMNGSLEARIPFNATQAEFIAPAPEMSAFG